MTDWRSYNQIARRYDAVWGSRFEAVAQQIWTLIRPAAGANILDLGTGTGIVPRGLGRRVDRLGSVVACDRSLEMLSVARAGLPKLRVLAADLLALPFRPASFEVVTASFVLSHLADHGAALGEAFRVLKSSGTFATTSWARDTSPWTGAWGDLLAEAVSRNRVEAAVAQVAPSETFFERADKLEAALEGAGFSRVQIHTMVVKSGLSLEEYLADRALSSGGRFAQHFLGPEKWRRFIARARQQLHRSLGSHCDYSRGVLIGLGRRT